jgi:hypothetical protein
MPVFGTDLIVTSLPLTKGGQEGFSLGLSRRENLPYPLFRKEGDLMAISMVTPESCLPNIRGV